MPNTSKMYSITHLSTAKPITISQLVYVPRTGTTPGLGSTTDDISSHSQITRQTHIPSLVGGISPSLQQKSLSAFNPALAQFSNAYLWVAHPDRTLSVYNFSTGVLVASVAALLSDITLIYGYDQGVFIGCANGYVYHFSHAWDTPSGNPVRPKLSFIYSRGVDEAVTKYAINAEKSVISDMQDSNRLNKKKVTQSNRITMTPMKQQQQQQPSSSSSISTSHPLPSVPRTDYHLHTTYSHILSQPHPTALQTAMFSPSLRALVLKLPVGVFLFSPSFIAGDSALVARTSLKSAFKYLPTLTAPVGLNQGHESHSYAYHRYHQLISSTPHASQMLSLPQLSSPSSPTPVYLLTQAELFSIEGQGFARCLYRFYDTPVNEVFDAIKSSKMLGLIDAAIPESMATSPPNLDVQSRMMMGLPQSQSVTASRRRGGANGHLLYKYIFTSDGFCFCLQISPIQATVVAWNDSLKRLITGHGITLSRVYLLTYSYNITYIACLDHDAQQVFIIGVTINKSDGDSSDTHTLSIHTINHYTFPSPMLVTAIPIHIQPNREDVNGSLYANTIQNGSESLFPLLLASIKPSPEEIATRPSSSSSSSSSSPANTNTDNILTSKTINILSFPIHTTQLPEHSLQPSQPVIAHHVIDLSSPSAAQQPGVFGDEEKTPDFRPSKPSKYSFTPSLLSSPISPIRPSLSKDDHPPGKDSSTLSYLTPIKRPSDFHQRLLLDRVRQQRSGDATTTPHHGHHTQQINEYVERIKSLQEEIDQLKQQTHDLDTLKASLEDERARSSQQSTDLESLSQKLQQAQHEVETLKQQLHDAHTRLEQLQQEGSTKDQTIANLQKEVDALAETRQQMELLQQEKASLIDDLHKTKEQCDTLHAQISKLENERDVQYNGLQSKYDTLQAEYEEAKQDHLDQLHLLKSESEHEVNAEYQSMRDQQAILSERLQQEISQHEAVQAEFDRLSLQLETLLEEKSKEVDQRSSVVKDLQSENVEMFNRIEKYAEEIQELEQMNDDLVLEKEELLMQLDVAKQLQESSEVRYKESLKEVGQHVDELTQTLETLRERETQLINQLKLISEGYDSLKSEHQQTVAALATATAAASAATLVSELKSQLKSAKKNYLDLESQLEKSQHDYIDLEERHARLVRESREQNELTIFLSEQQKRQLSEAEDEVKRLTAEIQRLTEENEYYIKAHDTQAADYEVLHAEYTRYKDECERLGKEMESLTSEVEQVQKQLHDVQQQLENATKESTGGSAEIDALKAQCEDYEKTTISQKEMLDEQQKTIDDLRKQLEEQNTDTNATITSLQSQLDELTKHIEDKDREYTQQLAAKDEEYSALLSQLKEQHAQEIAQQLAKTVACEEEIQSLNNKIHELEEKNATLEQESDRAKEDLSLLQEQYSTLQAAQEQADAAASRGEDVDSQLKTELEAIKKQKEEFEQANTMLEFEKKVASMELDELKQHLEEKREECIVLKEKAYEHAEVANTLAKLQEEFDTQRRHLHSVRLQLSNQTEAYEQLSHKYGQTSHQLQTLLHNFHELFVASQAERKQMSALQQEADSIRKRIASMLEFMDQLENQPQQQAIETKHLSPTPSQQ